MTNLIRTQPIPTASFLPRPVLADPQPQPKSERPKKAIWSWPTILASSLAGAAVAAFKGCWHGKMGWPVGIEGYSYQVCLSCGAMRLFDEKAFTAYGPFRYDLTELIAWEKSRRKCVED